MKGAPLNSARKIGGETIGGARAALIRPWIVRAVALIFLAGLAHAWLHDAHVGEAGHFGMAIEKACPLEKVASTICVAVPKRLHTIWPGATMRIREWSRVAALDISTAPRGPPIA